MSNNEVEQVLNLEGLLCPIPVVKISNAIKDIAMDGTIKATATDPGVMMDIPAWCSTTGNELVSMDEENDIFTFKIKRKS